MGQLVEVIFEGVNEDQAVAVCAAIQDHETGSALVAQAKAEGNLGEASLESLPIAPSLSLVNAHLRVLAYEGGPFDVELNFDLDEQEATSRQALQSGLCHYSANVAGKSGVRRYFGGLEPAADEDTRLFTGTALGPYLLR